MQEIEPQRYGTRGGWQLIVKIAGTSAMGGGGASEGQTGNGTAWEKSGGRIGHLFGRPGFDEGLLLNVSCSNQGYDLAGGSWR